MPIRTKNQNTYTHGDWNAICDVCGFKFKASDLKKRWDGFMVCAEDWETRHESDFFRAPKEDQSVDWTRPEANSNEYNANASGESIDDINEYLYPALAAYYKANDYYTDGSGDIIMPDHSKYGHNLTLTCTQEAYPLGADQCTSPPDVSIVGDNYVRIQNRWAFYRDIRNTKLDKAGNFMIWTCTLQYDDNPADFDYGTANQGGHYTTDSELFSGYQIAGVPPFGWEARVIWNEAGEQNKTSLQETIPVDGRTTTLVGGFRPSTSFYFAYNSSDNGFVSALKTHDDIEGPATRIPDHLPAQAGRFMFRSTSNNATPFKDYQVWSFAIEPPYMNETIDWLAKNPGRIPTWWQGVG